jgi:predicted dehydrogenase
MKDIRIGVAGLGSRGRYWVELMQKVGGYRIVALFDRIGPLHEQGLAVLKNREGVKTYRDWHAFLADPNMDAVAVCVRCKEQGAMAAEALEAGKHVNSEVPAAHTLADCWRIVTAQERTGRLYMLGDQARYAGFVQAWKDLVAKGSLGRVTFCEGQYLGYYGTRQFFQDPKTGTFHTVEELADHPDAKPTWLQEMPPIHYLPHELSPMLKVLDDRIVEVTAMSTRAPSYSHPEINQPDIQVALMKTAKDAILRMATGFTQPVCHAIGHHWYQVMGTRGGVEWRRSGREQCKLWLADGQMHDVAEVDWRWQRTDAPPAAWGSGHNDTDYYVHAMFRDALQGVKPLEWDVYDMMGTAAPAILAAESIAQGSRPMQVPDFRPNARRRVGELPKEH